MKRAPQRGFTYIEMLIVMGLVGVIASFGMAFSVSSIARSSVTGERDLFVTLLLRGARAEAIANVDESSHGIYIDNTCHRYILFTGNSFSPSAGCATTPRQISFTNERITVTNALGNEIVFEQLSGNVTKGAGTITLTNGEATQEIGINAVGQIDW
jgi:prepilin-type N-terminal cleavage/methylation domain-containing protein